MSGQQLATLPERTNGARASPPKLNITIAVAALENLGGTCWPQLVRELQRADIVNVFSASYYSFLPGSLPAVLAARALGMPAVMNDWCGEACERYEWTKVCAQWLVLYRESVHAPAVTATTAA